MREMLTARPRGQDLKLPQASRRRKRARLTGEELNRRRTWPLVWMLTRVMR